MVGLSNITPCSDLHSTSILISEDGAAKIADMSVWQEEISEGKTQRKDEPHDHGETESSYLAENVYSFGVVLLESSRAGFHTVHTGGLPRELGSGVHRQRSQHGLLA